MAAAPSSAAVISTRNLRLTQFDRFSSALGGGGSWMPISRSIANAMTSSIHAIIVSFSSFDSRIFWRML